jgi:hypothetical protein
MKLAELAHFAKARTISAQITITVQLVPEVNIV